MPGMITQSRKNRGGRYQIFYLDLLWRPQNLNFISDHFGYEWFSIKAFLDEQERGHLRRIDLSDKNEERLLRVRLIRLHRLFWLLRKKEKGVIYYKLSKKAKDYEDYYGYFTRGPLWDSCEKRLNGKKSEIRYVDRIVEKEVEKKYKRTIIPREAV